MAITSRKRTGFIFQNLLGVFYEVQFNQDAGTGVARKHGLTVKSTPLYDQTEVVLTVDAASLADWKARQNSYRIHAAVYNTTQSLATILNAAS